jgi:hypothetical protein
MLTGRKLIKKAVKTECPTSTALAILSFHTVRHPEIHDLALAMVAIYQHAHHHSEGSYLAFLEKTEGREN